MPEEDNKILKYNHGEKSMSVSFVIYADLESSLFTNCSFDATKNKLDYYRGKNCMKNFSLDLREHATKLINYEKKETIPLTKEEKIAHRIKKKCYICKKKV